jgi:BlaI family transcriptional regulator, penicillinase repressor
MASERVYRLGDLQLRIMKILWSDGPSTVGHVHEQLGAEKLAYTTIATMLRKMEDRGLVRHRRQGRRFIYAAAISVDAVTRSMTDDLVERLFEGSLADAVSHLLTVREVSREELDELEQMIQEHKRDSRESHHG